MDEDEDEDEPVDEDDTKDEHVDEEEDWGRVQVCGCGGGGKVRRDEEDIPREDLHRGVNKTTFSPPPPDVNTQGSASTVVKLIPYSTHGAKKKSEFGYGDAG